MLGMRQCALVLCTILLTSCTPRQCVTASKIAYNATGTSSLTPAALPLPSGSMAFLHFNFQFIGSDVVTRRQALESVLKSVLVTAAPPGVAVRCGNYFAYPATTPGYTGYSSIVYETDLWNTRTVYPDTDALQKVDKATLPQAILGSNQFIQHQIEAQFNGSVDVTLTQRFYYKTAQQQQDETADPSPDRTPFWADTLSRIQLTGPELLPFSADKAAVFTTAVYSAGAGTIYSLNVSDFSTNSTIMAARKLLQSSPPTLVVDVWTNSRAANFTPSAFWGGVLRGGALQSVGPHKANWTGTFLNATMYLSNINETFVGTIQDMPAASNSGTAAPPAEDGGLSAGAIAGIVIAAVAAAAIAVAVATVLVVRRRRSAAQRPTGQCPAAAETDSSLDSSEDGAIGTKPAVGTGLAAKSVPHTQRATSMATETAPASRTGFQPQLRAADIQFSTDPTGARVVLGGGACSTVYRGRHLHRDVAVKVLRLDGGLAHAVQREVQLAERVSRDANVVQVYGAALAQDGRSVMLVMELMQGGDLRAALDGPQGAQYLWHGRGSGIAADIACGLAYIHTTGVVHRDLKSGNVLLTADGRTAKVADIGAAKMLDAEYVSQHFGTLAWAAPELLLADRGSPLDEKADVYSLGVVLWELVTGETPVRGGMRPVRAPGECPAAVAELIAECMAAAPGDRPDADSVGKRLQQLTHSRR